PKPPPADVGAAAPGPGPPPEPPAGEPTPSFAGFGGTRLGGGLETGRLGVAGIRSGSRRGASRVGRALSAETGASASATGVGAGRGAAFGLTRGAGARLRT